MLKITFYLKSGQSFDIYASEFSIKTNTLDGNIVGITWKNADRYLSRLEKIDLQDISAIVSAEIETEIEKEVIE